MSDPLSTLPGSVDPPDDAEPRRTAETTPTYLGGHLPLVDPSVLAALEADVDDPAIARRFARDYAQMWEGRYARLAAAFEPKTVTPPWMSSSVSKTASTRSASLDLPAANLASQAYFRVLVQADKADEQT